MNEITLDKVLEKEPQKQIEKVHTVCKLCCFAVYEGNTQTGCKLGRTEIFRKQGHLVEAYDNDKEFDIINGRKCIAFRSEEWAKDKKNIEELVKKEIELKLSVVIILEDETIDSVEKTISALRNQQVKPLEVVFIDKQKKLPMSDLNSHLYDIIGNDFTWRISVSLNKGIFKTEAIDLAIPNLKGSYYSIFDGGQIPPPNFISDINKSINEKLEKFCVIEPSEKYGGLTVQLGFHKMINGNKGITVEDKDYIDDGKLRKLAPGLKILSGIVSKAKYLAEGYEQPHMIKKMEEVVIEES